MSQIDRESFKQIQENLKYKNLYMHYVSTMFGKNSQSMENITTIPENFHFDVVQDKLWSNTKLNEENGAVGILLATKALMQLLSTPIVKMLSNSLGYRIPTVLGTFVLLLASLSTLSYLYINIEISLCVKFNTNGWARKQCLFSFYVHINQFLPLDKDIFGYCWRVQCRVLLPHV